MDRMLYVAMTGARQMLNAQAMVSHNLANANTTGFRADLESVRAMPVYGAGLPTRAFAMTERSAVDHTPGSIEQTGNPLDFAVDGDGYFAVLAPDGTEAYTRNGDFQVSVNGLLTTRTGLPVLGEGGPITLPVSEQVVVARDGTISVRPLGQQANALAQVDRIKLVRPEPGELDKSEDGLFRLPEGRAAPPDAAVHVVQGALESSNVNSVDQLIDLMNYQRQYDLAVTAMKSASDIESASSQMMRLR
jgi:flagellar basal-body rod protein FlgF